MSKALKGTGIYALICPTTGAIKYVGQSRNMRRRYQQHCAASDASSSRPLALWLAELRLDKKKPKAIALEQITDTSILDSAEKGWIEALSQRFELLNMTAGGAGAVKGEGTGQSAPVRMPEDSDVEDAIKRAVHKVKSKPNNPVLKRPKSIKRTTPTIGATDLQLTAKQEAFAFAFVETGNASEAYRRAYDVSPDCKPETIWSAASRLRTDAIVSARIEELREEMAEMGMITLNSITNDLKHARNLAEELEKPETMVKATTEIAKLHGLTAERVEITGRNGGPVETKQTTDEKDLARKLAFLLRQGVNAIEKGDGE